MALQRVGNRCTCLHCQTVVQLIRPMKGENKYFVQTAEEVFVLYLSQCPNCGRLIMSIEERILDESGEVVDVERSIIWPLSSGRPPAPLEVPEHIARDYNEASLVLPFSPKASAALSRRCLQVVLWEAGETKSTNLSRQIDEALPSLPTHIAHNVDAIRQIGNFAAHEQKSEHTGEILDIEPGEAEWNLDVLEALFDFYYVKPELERRKREALNEKLEEAGKPPLKGP